MHVAFSCQTFIFVYRLSVCVKPQLRLHDWCDFCVDTALQSLHIITSYAVEITNIIYNMDLTKSEMKLQLGYWHQRADERHGNPPPR